MNKLNKTTSLHSQLSCQKWDKQWRQVVRAANQGVQVQHPTPSCAVLVLLKMAFPTLYANGTSTSITVAFKVDSVAFLANFESVWDLTSFQLPSLMPLGACCPFCSVVHKLSTLPSQSIFFRTACMTQLSHSYSALTFPQSCLVPIPCFFCLFIFLQGSAWNSYFPQGHTSQPTLFPYLQPHCFWVPTFLTSVPPRPLSRLQPCPPLGSAPVYAFLHGVHGFFIYI